MTPSPLRPTGRSVEATDASTALRDATRRAHDQVDRLVQEHLGAITLPRYGDLLEALASVHLPLDGELRRHGLVPTAVAGPLRDDLHDLGRAPGRAELPTFRFDDPAEALGAWYVAEGSTLGGRVLTAMVRRELPAAPVRFLRRGEAAPGSWIAVRRRLDLSLREPTARRAAVAGARSVFDEFAAALATPPLAAGGPDALSP